MHPRPAQAPEGGEGHFELQSETPETEKKESDPEGHHCQYSDFTMTKAYIISCIIFNSSGVLSRSSYYKLFCYKRGYECNTII